MIYNTLNYSQTIIDLQKNPKSKLVQPQNINSFLSHNYHSLQNLNRKFEMDMNDLKNYSINEIQFIDIREMNETPIVKNGIVKKIPQSKLEMNDLNQNNKVTIIVCQSGKRSFEFVKNNYQKTNGKMFSLFGGINELINYLDGR